MTLTLELALLVPVAQISPATYDELEAAVQRVSAGRAPRGWGRICARAAEDLNVHAGVVTAIAMHETGLWAYGGRDAVFSATPAFHNFGGIKTADSRATHRFATDPLGVLGLVAHVAWYVHVRHVGWFCDADHDPRHFSDALGTTIEKVMHPRGGTLRLVADLGRGVWNTSDGYAENIARHLVTLNG